MQLILVGYLSTLELSKSLYAASIVTKLYLTEGEEPMKAYMTDLQLFRETTPLYLYYQTQTTRRRAEFKELVVEHNWPRSATLEDVDKFQHKYVC